MPRGLQTLKGVVLPTQGRRSSVRAGDHRENITFCSAQLSAIAPAVRLFNFVQGPLLSPRGFFNALSGRLSCDPAACLVMAIVHVVSERVGGFPNSVCGHLRKVLLQLNNRQQRLLRSLGADLSLTHTTRPRQAG